jgi:hypothetical protein
VDAFGMADMLKIQEERSARPEQIGTPGNICDSAMNGFARLSTLRLASITDARSGWSI